MEQEIWKHLRVKLETHNKIKGLAGIKGMKIDEIINYLFDKEVNSKKTTISDYRLKGKK